MAYHIPFEHRKQGTPIYIGFDAPRAIPVRPKKAWNWWAFFGFPLSIVGLLSAGILSPVALLFNLIGLRKRPRKLATVGTVISLVGSLMLAGFIVAGVSQRMHHHRSHQVMVAKQVQNHQIAKTKTTMVTAQKELEDYRDGHDGYLPNDIDGCMLMIKHEDYWGNSLRFEESPNSGMLRSAGPDQEFDTRDDLTSKIEGKTNRQTLLPVEVD
jgi:hypothetical protein